jgi:hypothetical protein
VSVVKVERKTIWEFSIERNLQLSKIFDFNELRHHFKWHFRLVCDAILLSRNPLKNFSSDLRTWKTRAMYVCDYVCMYVCITSLEMYRRS